MTILAVLVALHVLGVVWWIGGVAFITGVALPSMHRLGASERIERILQIERRFAWQARVAVLVVGITGIWMLALSGGVARLNFADGWWLDLMILVWALFALMLFVVEPLGLPARIGLIHHRVGFLVLHAVLLSLGLAAIFCGVIGARGGFI